MDISLTDVDGISDGMERRLNKNGIETVEGLAGSSLEEIAEIKGLGESRGADLIDNAGDVLAEQETATTPTERLDTVTVNYEVPCEVALFFLHGMIEEAVRLHSRNDLSDRNRAYDLVERIMAQYVEDGVEQGSEEVWELELDVTMDELNIMTRALGAITTEYQGTPGIQNAYGPLRSIRKSIDEDRDEHWGL